MIEEVLVVVSDEEGSLDDVAEEAEEKEVEEGAEEEGCTVGCVVEKAFVVPPEVAGPDDIVAEEEELDVPCCELKALL